MSGFNAEPTCVIEIYPYEGGFYEIVALGGHLLSCQVSSRIDGSPGGFVLRLAPNGPGATVNAAAPDWTSVFTPMSFVLIGMSRGLHSQIVLTGVVSSIQESQDWMHGGQVTRTIQVDGAGFSYFFDSFNWSVMSFQAVTASQAVGEAITGNQDSGVQATFGTGLLGGASSAESNPAVIGQNWYTELMAGTKGILAKTSVSYQGSRVLFNDTVSTSFQPFPDVFIPTYDNFLISQGSWTAKFMSIFPAPWYEFFITTAPPGFYGKGSASKTFKMARLPGAAAVSPCVVARINPQPVLTAKATGATLPFNLTGIDASLWTALPIFKLEQHGFLNSTVAFSAAQVRNMYTINPLQSRALFGDSNTNTNVFFYTCAGACDVNSIHRFGYRPEITATEWSTDPTGSAGANKELDVPQTWATLLARTISQYEPSHLMATGSVAIPLRPDILAGCRFEYSPFRGQAPWTFYIDGVDHEFVFGGPSLTILSLSRGLPSSIYADMSQKGIFYACLTGLTDRKEGQYEIRTATKDDIGLTIFGPQDPALAELLGSIAAAYVTPQTP